MNVIARLTVIALFVIIAVAHPAPSTPCSNAEGMYNEAHTYTQNAAHNTGAKAAAPAPMKTQSHGYNHQSAPVTAPVTNNHNVHNHHGSQSHGATPTTGTPTPSSAPATTSGSAISLENTDAMAVGNNTLSIGAEEDRAAAAANANDGNDIMLGAQPGGSLGFVGNLGNMFKFPVPSPSAN